jgi:hypothetical protein
MTTEPITIGQREAAILTGLSALTLKRRTDEGQPTGRTRIGRRVVFHLATLRAWLAANTTATPSTTTH